MSDDRTIALRSQTPPDVAEMAGLIKAMLPNGQKLSDQEALAGAMYGKAHGLSPFKGEYYIIPGKGIFPGYRGEMRMNEAREYYTQTRPLRNDEAAEHEIMPGDTARIVELYQPDLMARMRTMGVQYQPIQGVGIVRKSEKYKTEDWVGEYPNKRKVKLDPALPIDPPTGRSWAWKAEQRALKDAMRHMQGGADILNETVDDRLADAEQSADTVMAEVRNLPESEQQATLARNVAAMRGPGTDDPLGVDSHQRPEPVILPTGRVFMDTADRERADIIEGEFRKETSAIQTPATIKARILELVADKEWKLEPANSEQVGKINMAWAILIPDRDTRRAVREYLLDHDSSAYTRGEIASLLTWFDMQRDAAGELVPGAQAIADAKTLTAVTVAPALFDNEAAGK